MGVSDEHARRLAWAEWRLQWAEWRIAQLEKRVGELGGAAPAQPAAEMPVAAEPPTKPWEPVAPIAEAPSASAPATAPPHAPPPASFPTPPAPKPFDWESLIGVRLFAWVGGAALFIGAALFLSYSIQQNLISPTVRVALGLVVGALGLFGGDRVRLVADRAAQAVSGAGAAILYASLFAASSLYHLMPSSAAFAGMALVTVATGALAVMRDAFMLAILGLLGGFSTPYLLSTGEDHSLGLFAYVALLDAGVVTVATKKRWPTIGLLGVMGTSLIFVGWAMKFLTHDKAPYALVAAAALAGLFALTTPDARRGGAGEASATPSPLVRTTTAIAATLPMLFAVVVASRGRLDVDPFVLVAYLLVLSLGTWIAGMRVEVAALPSIAAVFSATTLAVRVDDSLFPLRRAPTLAAFALVPAGFFVAWLARRTKKDEAALRVAAILAIVGAAALVAIHVVVVDDDATRPIAPLALYAGAHVALLVALAAVSERPAIGFGALALSVVLLLTQSAAFDPDRLTAFVVLAAVPAALFWALPFHPRLRAGTIAWATSATSLVLHYPFFYVYSLDRPSHDGASGALAVAFGLLGLLMLIFARRQPGLTVGATALLGGVSLLFFTSAFPILLHDEWLTVAWALEAAALAWMRGRVKHRGLLVASGLLVGATLSRLVMNPAVFEYHQRSATPILNWWLYGYGVSALAILAARRFLANDEDAQKAKLPALFGVAAGILVFVLLNIEIADAFSTGESVTFDFSAGSLARDMTFTLAWGVYALVLFAIGMIGKSRGARIWALVVLLAAIAKAALHDLWEMGSLYRVGALVGLALALLVVSFVTQRFVLRKDG